MKTIKTKRRVRGAIKVLSCNSGKIIFYTMTLFAIVCQLSCIGVKREPAMGSWEAYCVRYGINSQRPTEEQTDFYLDCYAGSVEEEKDLEQF